jgi:hypothetical protein
MAESEKKFRYTYTFLYQSVAVYATTLAAYIVIRGLLIEKEFGIVLNDPVVFLLSAIIIFSALAIIYNMWLHRCIRISQDTIILESRLRQFRIERSNVSSIRRSFSRENGFPRTPVIIFSLKERRRPLRIRTYNFEKNEELFAELKNWAGRLLDERRRLRRKGGSPS